MFITISIVSPLFLTRNRRFDFRVHSCSSLVHHSAQHAACLHPCHPAPTSSSVTIVHLNTGSHHSVLSHHCSAQLQRPSISAQCLSFSSFISPHRSQCCSAQRQLSALNVYHCPQHPGCLHRRSVKLRFPSFFFTHCPHCHVTDIWSILLIVVQLNFSSAHQSALTVCHCPQHRALNFSSHHSFHTNYSSLRHITIHVPGTVSSTPSIQLSSSSLSSIHSHFCHHFPSSSVCVQPSTSML